MTVRCGIDRVEIARMERLLAETSAEHLLGIFSLEELQEPGDGMPSAADLAARFAAKEACLKLFPRETALGEIGPRDFVLMRDAAHGHRIACTPKGQTLLDRHQLQPITVSLSHGDGSASAVASTRSNEIDVPLSGKRLYHLLPIRRRVVLSNLRTAFGETLSNEQIVRLAQAFYAHVWQFLVEFLSFPWLSAARRAALVRVENQEAILRVSEQGKGVLVLSGHFGNFEVATIAGIGNFPQYRGRLHILRRPLHPEWLDRLVTQRFRRAGLGVLPKKGALNTILDRLAANDAVVFVMDQHAGGRDGVRVDFFGRPAWTFRSLAIISLATGVPVVPLASWREPGGQHVLRFEEALPIIECEDQNEAIRLNTRAYNAALERLVLRHPQQWFWMHRRWKDDR